MTLLDNSGTKAYRKLAEELRRDGVSEQEYLKIIDMKLIGWRENKDMSKRIKTLLKILFHTFF